MDFIIEVHIFLFKIVTFTGLSYKYRKKKIIKKSVKTLDK
ncbi:hypothetical protein HMPREF0526_10119 [Lactobacillus jensenii JV-V16]|nr:hypothetical protein HMPREF0526_10119 [Lactobacillus jensenii JV-V16]